MVDGGACGLGRATGTICGGLFCVRCCCIPPPAVETDARRKGTPWGWGTFTRTPVDTEARLDGAIPCCC